MYENILQDEMGGKPSCSKRMSSIVEDDESYDAIRQNQMEEEKNREIIKTSWNVYMSKLNEYTMTVFITLLKKRSRYAKKLGFAGMSKEDMEKDLYVIQYAVNFSYFMFMIVDHMDQSEKLQKTVVEIQDYLRDINLPGSALLDYKYFMIKHMRHEEIINKKEARVWHGFLDNVLAPLRR